MFMSVKANTRAQAIALARNMCRCHRMTFAGVKWFENGAVQTMTWAEIDF